MNDVRGRSVRHAPCLYLSTPRMLNYTAAISVSCDLTNQSSQIVDHCCAGCVKCHVRIGNQLQPGSRYLTSSVVILLIWHKFVWRVTAWNSSNAWMASFSSRWKLSFNFSKQGPSLEDWRSQSYTTSTEYYSMKSGHKRYITQDVLYAGIPWLWTAIMIAKTGARGGLAKYPTWFIWQGQHEACGPTPAPPPSWVLC